MKYWIMVLALIVFFMVMAMLPWIFPTKIQAEKTPRWHAKDYQILFHAGRATATRFKFKDGLECVKTLGKNGITCDWEGLRK